MSPMNRRSVLKRASALGVGASALGANRRLFAQGTPDASPVAAAPEGEPIRIGASVSTTGTNGRTGLYQQEAYQLWEAQKNASGGLLGRPLVKRINQQTFENIALALTFSFAAVDWMMSVEPLWYSTMYGAIVALSALLTVLHLQSSAQAAGSSARPCF